MFDGKKLAQLAKEQFNVLITLSQIEDALRGRFYDMDAAIRALILAAATREPMLLIGPPGTGKSLLIRAFSELLGAPKWEDGGRPGQHYYFEYLLTPFTEPGELFGYYDIRSFMQGESGLRAATQRPDLERMDQGMMQGASIVYLDEVFNGSSAILNSLLAYTNERKFHDRGHLVDVKWLCIFAATNHIPEGSELRAIYDRFTLRYHVENIVRDRPELLKDRLSDFLAKAWAETYADGAAARRADAPKDLPKRLEAFRDAFERTVAPTSGLRPLPQSPHYNDIAFLADSARRLGLAEMSNRRLVRAVRLMAVHRMLRAVKTGEVDAKKTPPKLDIETPELLLIPNYLLDRHDPIAVEKLRRAILDTHRP